MNMRHRKYESLIVLRHYKEISPVEDRKLDNHLSSCSRCREFRDELARIMPVGSPSSQGVVESTLEEARKSFRRVLRDENPHTIRVTRLSWRGSETRRFQVPAYALAVVSVVMLAVGALTSYVLVNRKPAATIGGAGFLSELSTQNQDSVAINDVKFISTDQKTGEVRFSFNFMKRYEMKGSLEDRNIQKVLAYALVNSDNPGTRLRTIGMLDASPSARPDAQIKEALLRAVLSDDNVGVRRQALVALQKLPFDNDVRDAVLSVLKNDNNPGLRVAAINLISEKEFTSGTSSAKAARVDPKVLDILKEKSSSDQNKYVRLKAADMLKEITEL